uniref:Impact N-terminal domain-containing protein n=1 Tax=Magallana gigas TaxID=29159 RepID=A0A8W8J317_MAGGI
MFYSEGSAADHRILVYRFVDSAGKTHESFWDDGEHGAGRRLLQYMKTNQINNVGVVITRWSGPRHLGPDRWRIMEEHLCEVADTSLSSSVRSKERGGHRKGVPNSTDFNGSICCYH